MPNRTNVSSGSPWESKVGYSRAVRKGDQIFVSGTTASDENGQVVGANDPYAQTVFILEKIKRSLEQCGAQLSDVVRTRMYVTDVQRWPEVGKAHQEFFGEVMPASTLVEVSALVGPELLVEIEVDAVI